jgi:hypothetical protein
VVCLRLSNPQKRREIQPLRCVDVPPLFCAGGVCEPSSTPPTSPGILGEIILGAQTFQRVIIGDARNAPLYSRLALKREVATTIGGFRMCLAPSTCSCPHKVYLPYHPAPVSLHLPYTCNSVCSSRIYSKVHIIIAGCWALLGVGCWRSVAATVFHYCCRPKPPSIMPLAAQVPSASEARQR